MKVDVDHGHRGKAGGERGIATTAERDPLLFGEHDRRLVTQHRSPHDRAGQWNVSRLTATFFTSQ